MPDLRLPCPLSIKLNWLAMLPDLVRRVTYHRFVGVSKLESSKVSKLESSKFMIVRIHLVRGGVPPNAHLHHSNLLSLFLVNVIVLRYITLQGASSDTT